MTKYLKLLPVQLLLGIAIAFIAGEFFSFTAVCFFYTISVLIKDLLMLALPIVIFSYIVAAILSFEQKAPLFLLAILFLVVLSTAVAALVAYFVGRSFLPLLIDGLSFNEKVRLVTEVTSYFQITGLCWLPPNQAMLIGVSVGLLFSFVKVPGVKAFSISLRNAVNKALHYGLMPVLPLYVFGYVLKLEHEGNLRALFHNYAQVFMLVISCIVIYIALFYWIVSSFNGRQTLQNFKNMLPAGITAFCTMSSAATMPVTLECTEKNLKNPSFAQLAIPMTVNIHLLGSALGFPILTLAILLLKGLAIPSVAEYLPFLGFFCLAKFSSAGIPAGSVLVLLPLLQEYLGFTPDMLSLITTLYVLQDSIFTCTNVMGNGAFAMLTENLTMRRRFFTES